uniref:PIN-like domain-containing protein n=1 Tax=Anaerococcus mediterraneensis TaxID=1870984 RepID=UPI0009311086|nr:PIN-like domain-containing protein [Anaerococcus mediterraneensis]
MEYKEFESLIKNSEARIIIDTNILLDLVRYPIYISKNILEIFNKCVDLLWMPYQVFNEYESNKNKVFGDYKKKYQHFQNDLLNCAGKFEKDIKKKLDNGNRYNYHGLEDLEIKINQSLDLLRDNISNYKENIGTEFSMTQEKNPKIIQEIENLVQKIVEKQQIGKKMKIQEEINLIKEGEIRYKYKIPPGYKDNEKSDISEFGDLFIWKEIIEFSKSQQHKTIIFITNDLKEDWWQLDKNNKTLEINPLLKREFDENCGDASIEFFSLDGFYKLASQLYNLNNYQVYINLNRDDDNYIERIVDKVTETIGDYLFKSPDIYLQHKDELKIRGNIVVKRNSYEVLDVYSNFLENAMEYKYNLKLNVNIDIYSDKLINSNDSESIVKTFKISQKYVGDIEILIQRTINKDNINSDQNFLSKDIDFTNFKILQLNLKQNDKINVFFYDISKLDVKYI